MVFATLLHVEPDASINVERVLNVVLAVADGFISEEKHCGHGLMADIALPDVCSHFYASTLSQS